MKATRFHGTRTTAKLLCAGGVCSFGAYKFFSNHPTEDGMIWGAFLAVLAALCFYSGFSGKS